MREQILLATLTLLLAICSASSALAQGSQRSTNTVVSCTSPVVINQPSICTVTVTDATATGTPITPTGSVGFTLTGVGSLSTYSCVLTNIVTIGTSSCEVTFTSTSGGSATIVANYAGSSVHSGSAGMASITVTDVFRHDTATTVTCASPVVVGQPSRCTASVIDTSVPGATALEGSISFTSTGAGSLSTPSNCTLVSGSCSVTFTPSGAGTATVTASYSGDSSYEPSTSAPYSISVPTPDFSIYSDPASLTIAQGSASTSTMVLSGQNGFTSSVTLTASSISGIAVAFTPTTIYPAGSAYTTHTSTMMVTIDPSVAVGSYTITVTGTSGSLSRQLDISLIINSSPSPASPAPTIYGLAPAIFYGIVSGVVAAIAVAAGATIFLRRRKRLDWDRNIAGLLRAFRSSRPPVLYPKFLD